MTEDGTSAPAPPEARAQTAGTLLRIAREARGLHIAALATSLKIPPKKLESLERDRYDELPDVAFTRALAKAACRALKIDAAPVLALLPSLNEGALDQVHAGLNTPFRESAESDNSVSGWVRLPAFWVVAALVIAAVAVYFWPASLATVTALPPAITEEPVLPPVVQELAASAATSIEQPAAAASAVGSETAASAAVAASVPAATTRVALLTLSASAQSWVQVTDATGRMLVSRLLGAGEQLDLEGEVPLKATIGNASATTVKFRGVAVDLGAGARDNVARLELR